MVSDYMMLEFTPQRSFVHIHLSRASVQDFPSDLPLPFDFFDFASRECIIRPRPFAKTVARVIRSCFASCRAIAICSSGSCINEFVHLVTVRIPPLYHWCSCVT